MSAHFRLKYIFWIFPLPTVGFTPAVNVIFKVTYLQLSYFRILFWVTEIR